MRRAVWIPLAFFILSAGVLMLVGLAAIGADQSDAQVAQNALRAEKASRPSTLFEQARQMFKPLPAAMPDSEADLPAMVELGKKLYSEENLSINRTQSCATCHPIDNKRPGTDNQPHSPGAEGELGTRNAPTVLNAGFELAQFWDGRAADLVEQAKGPILNPIEMGMPNAEAVVQRAKELDYVAQFNQAFPGQKEPVTFDNIARAIAAFERTLVSPARFDDYLRGDEAALTTEEKRGLELFMTYGCTDCHLGPMLGGNRFMKAGVHHPYKNQEDLGRFDVTQRDRDKHVFRVPSLRNVTLTAPYFHDGQVATIAEAVDQMAWMQLDVKLTDDEIKLIVQFLTTLADKPRTTAPAPKVKAPDWVQTFQTGQASHPMPELAREGLDLLEHTYERLGPGAKKAEDRYSGSGLNCTNCHYNQGTKPYGNAWVGVMNRYPRHSGRSNGQERIQDRINDCMMRSLNGRAMPDDSQPMRAIVAYFEWLSQDVPPKIAGAAAPPIKIPDRAANLVAGREVYLTYCQSCHGADGGGYRSMAAGKEGPFVIPPLWGKDSYNNGAGMTRVLTAAAFIHANMPLGTPWDRPALTDEQAFDVAAYINSQSRPEHTTLEQDYPDRTKKPVDCPYPPYADDFPPMQHKLGPFLPILKARGEKNADH